jgi:serine phosphatase RsbU (regulator of sigma subunit)
MDDFTRRAATTDRPGLARLLATHVREMTAPEWLAVWIRRADGAFVCADDSGANPSVLDLDSDAATSELLWRGAHFECAARATLGERLGLPHAPAAIVPVFDRHDHPVGLVAIGFEAAAMLDPALRPRLTSAAAHAGVAFEIIRMAEQLAERMDFSRRMDRELQIARDVQAQLFPASAPALENATLAAHCAQARSVGGDWYDYLPVGPRQVALVLADVSGKGVHAALRMANLQAHVRSQVGTTPEDPLRALRQVNRLLRERSTSGQFATMFFGVWSDASRRLNYVNCGHNPPLVLRANGEVEWLKATATVLGVFDEWECQLGRITLAPGDVLFAYSDGVTEAEGENELFGDDRLLAAVREARADGPQAIVDAVIARVQAFEDGAPTDDLTVLALSVR